MNAGVLTRENVAVEGSVIVDSVDVSGLDDSALDARWRQIGQARNRLEGFLAEAVTEKKRRTSPYDTAEALKTELRQSGQQAQRIMRDSEQLESLEATRGALSASRITAEHARILGTAAQCGPMDEAKMLAAAEIQTPERLRRTVREHQDELVGDDGTSSQRPRHRARPPDATLRAGDLRLDAN